MKITFFYRDFGNVPSAVAQRGNYFIDAVWEGLADKNPDLAVYCVNVGEKIDQSKFKVKKISNIKIVKGTGFLARAIDELYIGFGVAFKSLFRRSDLFVISTPPYISGLILALCQILLGRSYAIDVRDMYPRAYLDAGLLCEGGFIHRILNYINKIIFKKSTFVVCATKGQAGEISLLTGVVKPTTIYNGFPSSFLKAKRPQRDGFRVVTHGTLGVYQNIEFILQLAQSLEHQDVEFVIIGQGTKAEMVKQATATNISFLGELPIDEVIEQVAACDVGLCIRDETAQSKYSFPVKAWEYIGLKMPMLVYPRCEVSDVFPDMDGLTTFDTLDQEAFKESILKLKKKKQKEQIVRISGYENDINDFTREAQAKKFAKHFL